MIQLTSAYYEYKPRIHRKGLQVVEKCMSGNLIVFVSVPVFNCKIIEIQNHSPDVEIKKTEI